MRSRNLKPGFFKNEQLAEMPAEGRLLFAGLWCMADREGRLLDRIKRIKIELFPGDNFDIDALLNQLESGGLIVRYEAQGTPCIQVLNFLKHQHPHHKEPLSTLPMSGTSLGLSPPAIDKSPGQASDKPAASPSAARLIPDSPLLIPDSGSRIPENSPASSADTRAIGAVRSKDGPKPVGALLTQKPTLPGGVVLTPADLKRFKAATESDKPRFPLKVPGRPDLDATVPQPPSKAPERG